MSKLSSMTTMPMRSHSSNSSGDGGLWLVRMALTPAPFRICNWRSVARRLTAAPNAPKSWWSQTPWSFTARPFSRKPFCLSKAMERMPMGVT